MRTDKPGLPHVPKAARRTPSIRYAAAAVALSVAAGLSACAAPSGDAGEDGRADASPYAAKVQAHVEAMEAGMERARRDLALRALWRRIENPG